MLRGEIWSTIWPNDPTLKLRPILIVSNDHRNADRNMEDIVAVKITGLARDDGSKKPINPDEDIVYRFRKESIIRCSAIYSIEKLYLQKKLGALTSQQMEVVGEKLKIVLELN